NRERDDARAESERAANMSQRERDLDDEIRSHLRMAAEDRGEAAARREFGNITLIKEVTRDVWGGAWVEQLLQDLRFAVRMMLKNPTFTGLATLSLALGIGANTAIFSFMDAVMIRWLPVRDPGSLTLFQWHRKHGNDDSVVHDVSGHFD